MRPDPTTGAAGSGVPPPCCPPRSCPRPCCGTWTAPRRLRAPLDRRGARARRAIWREVVRRAGPPAGRPGPALTRAVHPGPLPVTLEPVAVVEALAGRVAEGSRRRSRGVRCAELLAELGAAGVPCALVTMSWRSLADALVAASRRHLRRRGHRRHGQRRQAGPGALSARLRRMLGVDPGDCVAVEDSPTGGSAAAAGVPTVGCRTSCPSPSFPGWSWSTPRRDDVCPAHRAGSAAADRSPEQVASL